MSKSKFSKRQIAGAILLSSTAIGATASGTASASLMNYIGKDTSYSDDVGIYARDTWNLLKGSIGDYAVSTMDKGGEILKSGVNKIGNLASNSYNKVVGSKFGGYVGKGASYVGNKASNAYNWVKYSKGGQWVSDKAGDVYNWVKDSKGGQWVSDKAGDVYKWVKDSKVGNFVSEHAWGVAAIGLLGALTYGTYRAIKAGINYYNFRNARNNLLESINIFSTTWYFTYPYAFNTIPTDAKDAEGNPINMDTAKRGMDIHERITNNLNELKNSVSSGQKYDPNNMVIAENIFNCEVKPEEKKGLNEHFERMRENYEKYREEYDKLNSNK